MTSEFLENVIPYMKNSYASELQRICGYFKDVAALPFI